MIKTGKAVSRENDILAEKINENLVKYDIKSFDIVGAIGAGKTAILERIIEKISKDYRILVINGDIVTRIDADRIEKHGAKSIQINTGRECALNAYHIHQILKNQGDLSKYDLLFIENVGNLICPSEFLLGADQRVTVVSVTEGEWVVEKHPMLFKMSEIAVINKIDLAGRLGTDVNKMINNAKMINPNIKVITTSAKTGTNIDILIKNLNL
ncbi:MAG: hydrogenase nickel incorporation protein HypB [Promethearchaeota archaeon]